MNPLLTSRACQAILPGALAAAGLAMLIVAASSADAQINIKGKVSLKGVVNLPSQSGLHQYTHVWAFAPPNGSGGANDNANFTAHVMSQSNVDGVSILEAWNAIETAPPDQDACFPSDTCQPDPGAPLMYHHYFWTTYDSIASGNPVKQWLDVSGGAKKVNILIAGEASGPTNPITPHYVTSPAWYDLFSPQQQDVINAIKDCTGEWGGAGPTGVTATYVGSTIQVTDSNNCCSAPPDQSALIQNGDLVWVTLTPAQCGTGTSGAFASTSGSTQFTYPIPSACTGMPALSAVTYIGVSQSWAVPYEYPYKNALKAFWAAVVAHYGPNFKIPANTGTPYFSRLNYFRFGGSVGSEWYPYCTSGGASGGLEMLGSPYQYTKMIDSMHASPPYTGWLNYYQEMGNYLQSLAPPVKVVHSINAAETPPDYDYGSQEAGYAVGWSNGFGVRDGFGSQGLSVKDYLNCNIDCDTLPNPPDPSASNWHPMFKKYNTYGLPLELQPIALSYPDDTNCTNGCSVSTYSGDLPTFLYSFATSVGGSDFEIYWRDLSLAYDVNNYCHFTTMLPPFACSQTGTSITLGGQVPDFTHLLNFFQASGQGNNPACGTNMPQTGSTGDCDYAININSAHGQH